ncbi:discoidin domain-containing protein [Rathayibacter sp. VKM Ac-2630]|uniref:discoidin domain-containing protein n=1 Tax=Rathayibacter sp. VKM Ac-2630 TaxID=1938617 RepID=UPI000981AB9B|nr:discoidin domain-containing protein [Rathayibacter sp. VKM Ac-2630]OOB92052.1 hypothetical protein B0T42_02165 [Rathayibacter sp. VKM Ac-2630]
MPRTPVRRASLLAGGLGLLLAAGVVAGPAPASAVTKVPTATAYTEPPGREDPTETTHEPELSRNGFVPDVAAEESAFSSRTAGEADFTAVDIPSRADIVTHEVTIALVAPPGTNPSFTTDDARRSLELADQFYNRETGGAVRFHLERIVDWQSIDEPIDCTNTGGLHDWVQRSIGWQPGPARHLVTMVPPGPPCPNWANAEQPWDPDDGGRVFEPGPDAIILTHELGHSISLPHAASLQCDTAWDAGPGVNCSREEYGNLTDLMGDSWTFTPLSAPSLARLGILSDTRQPTCGAPRIATIDTLGAGPGTPRALSWSDPQSGARYWVQYNDKNDATSDGGAYWSQWQTPRTVSGVQILKVPRGGLSPELLQRPGDGSVGNEFVQTGETVTLSSGTTIRVDSIDADTRQATVTVSVPCVEYLGNIVGSSTLTSSYTSDWSTTGAAIDGNAWSEWSAWPRVGEQWLDLRWPETVTIDSVSVQFASDSQDGDRQGTIPPRAWRIEYLDPTTGEWEPVADTAPAVPGRDRGVPNTVGFPAVSTQEIRVLFDSWGDWEEGGSTAVAELTVNAVAPIASLAPRGAEQTVATSTTGDLGLGVDVLDADDRVLGSRAVTFTIAGPAGFVDGTKSATVLSGSDGRATLPTIRTGTTTGAVTITATAQGVAPTALPSTTVAAAPASPPRRRHGSSPARWSSRSRRRTPGPVPRISRW